MSLAVDVLVVLAVLRFLLLAVVVGVALKTNNKQRREAALTIIKVLRPGLSRLRRDLPGGSS
ncbi:hypothetical protein [Pseudonocardia sp. WMMC193]|uniref:hypothetical protein n=1 Tax=Pseudonocardia sp. WMMC193 TaxID=2911965 RepID=UPI001F27AFB5|nr:hypothetical protein [Pseudonocardia sp. WMMC193]MCF7552202.1 hypothetical protein [Pseudonocardia sp. WMMC193]